MRAFLLFLAANVSTHAADETGYADSSALDLPALTVQGDKAETGTVEVKSGFIRKIPGFLNDPVRAVSFSPGVGVQNDLNIRPFIRGGDMDQSLVVLDGIPLMQPYHVGGTFSLFNLNTVESVELYREDFPVEYPGALSGVLRLKTRAPGSDRARAHSNLSLVRGDVFVEGPLVKNRLGVSASAQSFLFDQSLHGLLNVASRFSDDSLFQNDIQRYHDHINLPGFQDYHVGASWQARKNLRADYLGGIFLDDYAVVVPAQINIINPPIPVPNPNPNPNPIPVIPVVPRREINRSKKLSLDSVSSVGITNHMHFLRLGWDTGPRNFLENGFGFQFQRWDVDFKKAIQAVDSLALAQSSRLFHYRLVDAYAPAENHRFKFGFSYDYQRQNYRAELPYVLHDVIANSNMDMLAPLGLFSPYGFQIEKEDSLKSNFDYLGEYPARIRFSHRGALAEHFLGFFFSHTRETPTETLAYGVRGEYQSTSGEFFPSPRLSYRWHPDGENEFLFHSGLFSQNRLPYHERDRNPALKSEKSAQAGLQWTRRLPNGYQVMAGSYYKRYFDLVTPVLKPNGTIAMDGLMLPLPSSSLTDAEIRQLQAMMDTTLSIQTLPDSVRQLVYETFGNLIFDYGNTGDGMSLGTELAFFYRPKPAWDGWVSADFSFSYRRDHGDEPHYPHPYHRPVVLNWVNYFDMPGNYDISLTYRWAMGQAYTPYSGSMDEKSLKPIVIGPRNSGRLSPYHRLDMRLSRSVRRFGADFKIYLEVWNSMNDPNYFARDYRTGVLKSAQLNWPFPLFFLGVSGEI